MENDFRVGDWTVEPSLGRLSRDETSRRLEPKLMQLLVFFANHPGVVVSKQAITDAVWQSDYISENRLIHAIADLRRALDHGDGDSEHIETIPTHGYRLVAPVESSGGTGIDEGWHQIHLLDTPYGEFRLRQGENLIGRGPDVDVRLTVKWVSRHHARITITGDRVMLEDLGSKNGTFVQGERVDGVVDLNHGDEIRVGKRDVVLRFHGEIAETKTEPVLG